MKQILVKYDMEKPLEGQLSRIAEEMGTGKYRTLLFHIFSGILDDKVLTGVSKTLKETFEDCILAGTISAGEICAGSLMEKGILISAMLFEVTEIKLLFMEDVRGREKETGKKLCESISALSDVKAVELLLPGTEFSTRQVFEELFDLKGEIKVFGGYAGGHDLEVGEHYVFDENGLYDDCIFAICYIGKDFHINLDKSVGWQTLGHAFKVTKADENRLIEIEHRPAVEVYEKYLCINRNDNFAENTFEFPLILKVEDDELLRHTIDVEEDGTLDLAGYVTDGMDVYLCYGNPTLIVQRVNQRLREVQEFAPQAILLYSCSVRKSFWENYVDMEMLPFDQLAVTAGFHTWGEVKRNPHTKQVLEYNITLLSIAMREGKGEPFDKGEVVIDDSVLKGQASLIKRLSQLVSATTTELQNAYDSLASMNEKLLQMSTHDALTGIYNRRWLDEYATQAIEESKETGEVCSFVMMDVDYFKRINDTHGHQTGDVVLVELASILMESVEGMEGSVVGRWGGEEFFAVLKNVGMERALEYSEKLRQNTRDHQFTGLDRTVTISLGVITTDGKDGWDNNTIISKVDDCLYEAKNTGRDRVVQFEKE